VTTKGKKKHLPKAMHPVGVVGKTEGPGIPGKVGTRKDLYEFAKPKSARAPKSKPPTKMN